MADGVTALNLQRDQVVQRKHNYIFTTTALEAPKHMEQDRHGWDGKVNGLLWFVLFWAHIGGVSEKKNLILAPLDK